MSHRRRRDDPCKNPGKREERESPELPEDLLSVLSDEERSMLLLTIAYDKATQACDADAETVLEVAKHLIVSSFLATHQYIPMSGVREFTDGIYDLIGDYMEKLEEFVRIVDPKEGPVDRDDDPRVFVNTDVLEIEFDDGEGNIITKVVPK